MQDCFEAVPFLQREECVGFRAGGLGDGDVVNKYLKKKKKKRSFFLFIERALGLVEKWASLFLSISSLVAACYFIFFTGLQVMICFI